jgi:hypothetical protein
MNQAAGGSRFRFRPAATWRLAALMWRAARGAVRGALLAAVCALCGLCAAALLLLLLLLLQLRAAC